MEYQTGFFYLFSAVLLFAAFRVITARNPVHAVLYLMLAFSQASAVWFLLKAEFLAITLVLVYLGAVMVLFLFVVMMLDIDVEAVRKGFWRHFPLALLLGGFVSVELIAVVWSGFPTLTLNPDVAATGLHAPDHNNTKELGKLLYTQYLYAIEGAALILLLAMIAAIALTLRKRKDSKFVDPAVQVRVKAQDRLVVVPVQPTRAAEPVDAASTEEKKA